MPAATRYPKILASIEEWIPDHDFDISVHRKAEDRSPRHLAFTEWNDDDEASVTLGPSLESLPKAKRDAILLHEVGHVLLGPQVGSIDREERLADREAEKAFGVRIYYDPRDLLQTLKPGIRPRPVGLR